MPGNPNFNYSITKDTPGAVFEPVVDGGRRNGGGGYWRMPTVAEKAARELGAQLAAFPPEIREAIDSGKLRPEYSEIETGEGRNGQRTAANRITGFNSTGPNDTTYTYDLSGTKTGQFQNQRGGGGGFLNHLVGAISGGLADLDSSLKLSENAPIIAAIGVGILTAGAGTAIGSSMMNAGLLTSAEAASAAVLASGGTAAAATAAGAAATATATAVGSAIASTAVQVAQGRPLDQALGNAATSLLTSQVISPALRAEVKDVFSSPLVANTVTNMGTSLASGVLTGKTEDQILNSVVQAGAGTVVNSVANNIVKNTPGLNDPSIPPEARQIALAGVVGAIATGDGTKSMVNAAISAGTKAVLDTASDKLRPELVNTLQGTYNTATADTPETTSDAELPTLDEEPVVEEPVVEEPVVEEPVDGVDESYLSTLSPEELERYNAMQDPDYKSPLADLPEQDLGITQENWDSANSNIPEGGFTSAWQTAGSDRILINDDGTGTGINTETDESYALTPDEVGAMVDNKQLNTAESGYVAATGGTGGTPGGTAPAVVKVPAVGTPPAVVKPSVSTPSVPKAPAAPTTPLADAYIDNLVKASSSFDFRNAFDPLGLEKAREQDKTTKIASGGYLDKLLANPTSFDDLLRTLRS